MTSSSVASLEEVAAVVEVSWNAVVEDEEVAVIISGSESLPDPQSVGDIGPKLLTVTRHDSCVYLVCVYLCMHLFVFICGVHLCECVCTRASVCVGITVCACNRVCANVFVCACAPVSMYDPVRLALISPGSLMLFDFFSALHPTQLGLKLGRYDRCGGK